MIVPDYRRHRIEIVSTPVGGGRFNAVVHLSRTLSDAKPIVETVTCLKVSAALRNRRLAHTDRQVALFGVPLPRVSRADIESILAALRAVPNRLEGHYWDSETLYADVITPTGDGNSLIAHLAEGLRAEESRHQRLREGKLRPDGWK
jgi:hypothetical protein